MVTDPLVSLVVSEVSAPLAVDGGRTELIGVENAVARVRYHQGVNEECPDCIMSPEDMREYILEAVQVRAPYIRDVSIVMAS